MSSVSVYSYTNSVTYVADNVLKSLKDIIRLSGLDPTGLTERWESTQRALKTWIESKDLERVILEVYDPATDRLVIRWDIDIVYSWSANEGTFYTDTEQLRYHILKAGIAPSQAKYQILLQNKPGYPAVAGWGDGAYRSTTGMVKQSLGSTIEHSGLGANAGYWRKTS